MAGRAVLGIPGRPAFKERLRASGVYPFPFILNQTAKAKFDLLLQAGADPTATCEAGLTPAEQIRDAGPGQASGP